MIIDDVANLLVMERILVIQKPSGSGIYTKSLTPGKSDDQLVAAFLTALGSFISEMKQHQPLRKEQLLARKMEEIIGHRRFVIFLIEAEHVAVAAILKDEPRNPNLLEKRLRTLVKSIEEHFRNELINFQGNLQPFEPISKFLNQYLFVSLMETPWIFKPSSKTQILNEDTQLVKSAIWDIQSRLSEKEGLYFDQLTDLCLKKTGVVGYLEAIQALLTLIKNGELVPLDEKVEVPDFDLDDQIEGITLPPIMEGPTRPMEPGDEPSRPPDDPRDPIGDIPKDFPGEKEYNPPITTDPVVRDPISQGGQISGGIGKTGGQVTSVAHGKDKLLQVLIDPTTIQKITLESETGKPEGGNGGDFTPAPHDVEGSSVIERLRQIPSNDLPSSLVADILKRNIIFEQLETSNLSIVEKIGTFEELTADIRHLMMTGYIESISENPTDGLIIFIESSQENFLTVVSVARLGIGADTEGEEYLWIIARKRN